LTTGHTLVTGQTLTPDRTLVKPNHWSNHNRGSEPFPACEGGMSRIPSLPATSVMTASVMTRPGCRP
jgi:hypothetical protein